MTAVGKKQSAAPCKSDHLYPLISL